MSDLERQLGDLQADGRITDEDAHQVRTFAQFLKESAEAGGRGVALRNPAFRARWMPYLQGEADGPVEL